MRDSALKTSDSDNSRVKPINPGTLDFESIYRECGEKVLNLVYRFTRDKEIARDLTQDVFIKVYQNLNTFRKESQVTTWVYRIAVNQCLNFLKYSRRRRLINTLNRTLGEALHNGDATGQVESRSTDPGPDQIVEQRERDRIIRQAIDDLPAKYRLPFELYRNEGMSYQEIAQVMNISLSAVETRVHRARKRLLETLQPMREQL